MRAQFGKTKDTASFKLEPLAASMTLEGFLCTVAEYSEWLSRDALRSQQDHIAKTWLLRERSTGKVAAYMSLIMDAIKLSFTLKK